MKKLFFAIIALLCFFPITSFAQTATGSENISTAVLPQCRDVYSIVGPTQVKINTVAEYSMSEGEASRLVLPFGKFTITENEKTESLDVEREKLVHSFLEPGIVKMTLALDKSVHNCEGDISVEIHVFREEIVYLGPERAELSDPTISTIFRQKSVLFEPIFIGQNFHFEEQSGVANAIATADIVIFNYNDIIGLFSELEKIQKIKETSFVKKKIFIISSYPKTFLSKVLASTLANLEAENVHVITIDQLNTLLNHWSYGDNRDMSAGESLSYEKSGFSFSMNSFLEYLSYSGVSYGFLGTMLALAVVALIFNILKQVIGFDVFSIYYPMMLAIIMSQIGVMFSVVFILLAIIAILLVRAISNRIQLLFNARKSFLISIYILLIFLALGMDNVFGGGIFTYSHFDRTLTILAIFAILFIVEKIIENISIFSRSGIFLILQYIFVVAIAFFVLSNTQLQYFLISYPDLIFAIVIVNFLVGRYMGLQLVEYVRFLPILRNIHEEE